MPINFYCKTAIHDNFVLVPGRSRPYYSRRRRPGPAGLLGRNRDYYVSTGNRQSERLSMTRSLLPPTTTPTTTTTGK